jgi:hypothetical protein
VECINTTRFRESIIWNIAHFTQMLNLNMNNVHAAAFDGAQLTREIILLRPPATILVRGE